MLTELGIGVPGKVRMCMDGKDRVYCIKKAHERDEFNYVKRIDHQDYRQIFSRRFSTTPAEKVAGIALVGNQRYICVFGTNMLIFFDAETLALVKRYSGKNVVSVQEFDADAAIVMTVEAGVAKLCFFAFSGIEEDLEEDQLDESFGLIPINIANEDNENLSFVIKRFMCNSLNEKLYVTTPGSILVCSFGDEVSSSSTARIELEIDLSDIGVDYTILDVMHTGALFIGYPDRYAIVGLDKKVIHGQTLSMTAGVLLAGGEYLVRSDIGKQIVIHKTGSPNDFSVIAIKADWVEICELFLSGDRKRLYAVVRSRDQTVSIRRFENPLSDVRFSDTNDPEAVPFVAAREKLQNGKIVILFSTGDLFNVDSGAFLLLDRVYDSSIPHYLITDRSVCTASGVIENLKKRRSQESAELAVTAAEDDHVAFLREYRDREFWNRVLEAVKHEMYLTRASEKSPNIAVAVSRVAFRRLQAQNRLHQ